MAELAKDVRASNDKRATEGFQKSGCEINVRTTIKSNNCLIYFLLMEI